MVKKCLQYCEKMLFVSIFKVNTFIYRAKRHKFVVKYQVAMGRKKNQAYYIPWSDEIVYIRCKRVFTRTLVYKMRQQYGLDIAIKISIWT